MEKFGGEIGRKYATINSTGRDALRDGLINEFNTVPEQLMNRFNISISLKKDSEEILRNVALTKVEELEKKLNIKLLLAGRDFPIHITILEGSFEGDTSENDRKTKEGIFNEITNNSELQEKLTRELLGKPLDFKYLLIDKGNLILTSTDIPQSILETRGTLAHEYAGYGLKPLPMNNILHMTISRINKLPENKQSLLQYEKEIINLRHSLSENPLSLTPDHLYMGSSYSLLTEKPELN